MNKKIELQALITEREGMLADNKERENKGEALAWQGCIFVDLAKEIRALDNKEDSQNDTQRLKSEIFALHLEFEKYLGDALERHPKVKFISERLRKLSDV